MANAPTKKGNIPYKVSELECEFWSIARNTFTQKASVNKYNKTPINEIGMKIIPVFLNHGFFIVSEFNYTRAIDYR
ncbi:MAG: hypothetical protein K2X95_01040 [Flavobacteriaceae bacterium]|nr:hypothetical protein [Flavobacteriaceae bacterium]